jgi:hypothetical protein
MKLNSNPSTAESGQERKGEDRRGEGRGGEKSSYA